MTEQPAIRIPEGSIVITPAQVYDKVVQLTEQVTKLIAQDAAEVSDRTDLKVRVEKIETRVRSLENKVWLASGFCAALGSGIGAAAARLLG